MKKLILLAGIGCMLSADAMENRREYRDPEDRPLHRAVLQGKVNIVTILLNHDKTDPNCPNTCGQTALHKAARMGLSDMIALLLNNKRVFVDPEDKGGYTPLFYAVTQGNSLPAARLLLQAGANPNQRMQIDNTLLTIAVQKDWPEMVSLLLEFNADPNEPAEQAEPKKMP